MRSSKDAAAPGGAFRCLLLAGALSLLAATNALAAGAPPASQFGRFSATGAIALGDTCSGTPEAPGVLTGRHMGNETISGECVVNAGEALVEGNLTITSGSTLIAAFGLNDRAGSGSSRLVVRGNLRLQAGATLLMGCEPGYFPCLDDPNPESASLTSRGEVSGDLIAREPLGVVLHASSIHGELRVHGGGGGLQCRPQGPFQTFPAYSDFEDLNVGSRLLVNGMQSCWLGVARTHVSGRLDILGDQMADPDAIEILANTVDGNLNCREDTMVWDSAEAVEQQLYPRVPEPNTVLGRRFGQCVLASPTTEGGPLGPGAF